MGMNYLPPLDDTDLGFFFFGAGTFGNAFDKTLNRAGSEWNRTFSDQAEYENYWESVFKMDYGVSVVTYLDSSSVLKGVAYVNLGGAPYTINGWHLDGLGRYRFTFYYMDEGVAPSGGAKVTTETISGPMSQLFAGWTEEKFYKLAEDISAGRASALVRVPGSPPSVAHFDAQIMPSSTANEDTLLNTAVFTPGLTLVLAVVWSYKGGGVGVGSSMRAYINGQWITATDDLIKNMTGKDSFDLIITRIEEE